MVDQPDAGETSEVDSRRRKLDTERGPMSRRGRIAGLVIVGILVCVGPPLLLAALAITREPEEWHWNDWVAQITQVVTGLIFFGFAWFLGRSSEQRAEALANAELITSMGALAMSSARSHAGQDSQALRIGADARAALQHYPRAERDEQSKLIEKIVDSYSDLVFGTFSRAAGLPRSIRDGLRDSAEDLVDDAERLVSGYASKRPERRSELQQMARHVQFAVNVGAEVRRSVAVPVAVNHSRSLDDLWAHAGGRDHSLRERLDTLRLLYRRELTVLHDWSVLLNAREGVLCDAAIHHVESTAGWLAPWYLARAGDGSLMPVSVTGGMLGDEPARLDRIPPSSDLPLHPRPMVHGALPEGVRSASIEAHVKLLRAASPVTVCVLTYELRCDDGQQRRIVLDGNHRLAAAWRIARAADDKVEKLPITVLEFRLGETRPLRDRVLRGPQGEWEGFTPDVAMIRSAWTRVPATRLVTPRAAPDAD
ncbi:MAG: hypothetical protein JNL54_07380 [Kineosporiaceae bacterium]|nr:hypothetical protein [Kineosporiaceae bacterium]